MSDTKPKTNTGAVDRANPRASLLKAAGLAVALGAITWLVAPMVLRPKVPADFPPRPDLKQLNPSLRALLETTDEEARRKSESADAVGKLGIVYHANQFFEQAAATYRIAARLAPGDPQWTYSQAFLQEELGRDKEQLSLLQKTLQLKPDHVPALIKTADWYFKVDRLEEAAHGYELAARAPAGAAALQAGFALGRVEARRRDWKKVIETIIPLTRSYPNAAPLYELLREAYAALGQTAVANEARQRAGYAKWKSVPPLEDPFQDQLSVYCYTPTRLLKQAGLLSRLGQADRAVELLRRAVQADPKDAAARELLARTLLTFYGDKPEALNDALAQLEECLRLRPEDPASLGGFANDFFKSPRPVAAAERLRALLRSHPDIPGAHFFLGQAADAVGETAEASVHYQAALRESPNNSAIFVKLGLISDRAGRIAEATALFRKAIQLNPANTDARLNLAIELMQRRNFTQGLKELNELLRLNPQDAAAHFCMGFAFLTMQRVDEAVSTFRQGLLYKPDDAEARFGLGSALAAQGKREEALLELREAQRLRPNHAPTMEMIGQLER